VSYLRLTHPSSRIRIRFDILFLAHNSTHPTASTQRRRNRSVRVTRSVSVTTRHRLRINTSVSPSTPIHYRPVPLRTSRTKSTRLSQQFHNCAHCSTGAPTSQPFSNSHHIRHHWAATDNFVAGLYWAHARNLSSKSLFKDTSRSVTYLWQVQVSRA
jgi:hypothetical protein